MLKPPLTMTISLRAADLKGLKYMAQQILAMVNLAKGITDLPIGTAGDTGIGFSINYTTPLDDRVADLRRQADELAAAAREEPKGRFLVDERNILLPAPNGGTVVQPTPTE